MKKIIAVTLCLIMAFSLAACSSSNATPPSTAISSDSSSTSDSNNAVTLKLNTAVSVTSTWYAGCERFSELVKEKTGGRYIIDVYSDCQLSGGSQPDAVTMHQAGDIDISCLGALTWANATVKTTMPCMPFLFTNFDEAVDAMNGDGGKAIAKVISDVGCGEVLAWGMNGFRQISTTKKEITCPDDLVGLKIRIPGNQMYIDLYTFLGADPVSLSFSELYTALSTGVVDAQENPYDTTMSANLQEVVKYCTGWNYSYEPIALTVSQKAWDSIPDADKDIFREAAEEAMAYQVGLAIDLDSTREQEMRDSGVQFYELSNAELQAFRDACSGFYDMQKSVMGDELFKAFGLN